MIKIELQAVVAPVVGRAQAVVAPVVEQVQAAVAVPAVSLNDLMPKNVTYWDAFVAVVSVVIQCITQMVAYLFEKLVGDNVTFGAYTEISSTESPSVSKNTAPFPPA